MARAAPRDRPAREGYRRLHGGVRERAEPVEVHFLWRPQLADPDDEIVLEAAVNGRSKVIVTHNVRHFAPAAGQFGLEVVTPGTFLKRINT